MSPGRLSHLSRGRFRRALPVVAALLAAAVTATLVGLGGDGTRLAGSSEAPRSSAPAGGGEVRLGTEIVQLRRDEVLRRVAVEVTNEGAAEVEVVDLELVVPAFDGVGVLAKGEPVRAGTSVNLPTPYGEPRCPPDSDAAIPPDPGRAEVLLTVRPADGGSAREAGEQRLRLTPEDPKGLLARVLGTECLARRLAREISLTFDPHWRLEGSGADAKVHGTLRARLLDPRRTFALTQVAGTVLYGVVPRGAAATRSPLAMVDADHPRATVPVTVSQGNCTGHAKGEIKKPYAFLVWLAEPGGPEQATPPVVSAADQAWFQRVCRF